MFHLVVLHRPALLPVRTPDIVVPLRVLDILLCQHTLALHDSFVVAVPRRTPRDRPLNSVYFLLLSARHLDLVEWVVQTVIVCDCGSCEFGQGPGQSELASERFQIGLTSQRQQNRISLVAKIRRKRILAFVPTTVYIAQTLSRVSSAAFLFLLQKRIVFDMRLLLQSRDIVKIPSHKHVICEARNHLVLIKCRLNALILVGVLSNVPLRPDTLFASTQSAGLLLALNFEGLWDCEIDEHVVKGVDKLFLGKAVLSAKPLGEFSPLKSFLQRRLRRLIIVWFGVASHFLLLCSYWISKRATKGDFTVFTLPEFQKMTRQLQVVYKKQLLLSLVCQLDRRCQFTVINYKMSSHTSKNKEKNS